VSKKWNDAALRKAKIKKAKKHVEKHYAKKKARRR
jgi:hypothetical protein